MKIKYEPLEEPASKIQPGEICLIDNVPHKRLEDKGPILDRRNLLPFLVGDTGIEWIHADTKVRPRRRITVDKVPVGVAFLLPSGAEYIRVESIELERVCDPETAAAWNELAKLQHLRILAMQVQTGRIMAFKQGTEVICVGSDLVIKA